ncbi:hypothetical protein TRVL_03455 [Trypanosoma vivax]|nr:hypothetical protein TRVL_03455 [Trypanosoma vivax]
MQHLYGMGTTNYVLRRRVRGPANVAMASSMRTTIRAVLFVALATVVPVTVMSQAVKNTSMLADCRFCLNVSGSNRTSKCLDKNVVLYGATRRTASVVLTASSGGLPCKRGTEKPELRLPRPYAKWFNCHNSTEVVNCTDSVTNHFIGSSGDYACRRNTKGDGKEYMCVECSLEHASYRKGSCLYGGEYVFFPNFTQYTGQLSCAGGACATDLSVYRKQLVLCAKGASVADPDTSRICYYLQWGNHWSLSACDGCKITDDDNITDEEWPVESQGQESSDVKESERDTPHSQPHDERQNVNDGTEVPQSSNDTPESEVGVKAEDADETAHVNGDHKRPVVEPNSDKESAVDVSNEKNKEETQPRGEKETERVPVNDPKREDGVTHSGVTESTAGDDTSAASTEKSNEKAPEPEGQLEGLAPKQIAGNRTLPYTAITGTAEALNSTLAALPADRVVVPGDGVALWRGRTLAACLPAALLCADVTVF